MTKQTYQMRYPRRRLLRAVIGTLTHIFMRIFTRTTVTGLHNIPRTGPAILVGNHVAMMEVVLMGIFTPRMVEIIGAGDLPLDPRYARMAHTWGFIPINRGTMDRKAMNTALDILKQGGLIGLFPEGGIWETTRKQAHPGAAWLSNKAQVPVIPMGFGGTFGSLQQLLKLKRPRLTMNIGTPIMPVQTNVEGKSRKDALQDSAEHIMARIADLVPQEEKERWRTITFDEYTLTTDVVNASGQPVDMPASCAIENSQSLSRLFFQPVILRALNRNLQVPVEPFLTLNQHPSSQDIVNAAQNTLGYLEENPHFLTYRFGKEIGKEMKDGLIQLRDLAQWSAENGLILNVRPTRRYRFEGDNEDRMESLNP